MFDLYFKIQGKVVAYGSYKELSENGVKLETYLNICGGKEQLENSEIDIRDFMEDTSKENLRHRIDETNVVNETDKVTHKEDTSCYVNITEMDTKANSISYSEIYNDDTHEHDKLVSTNIFLG